MKPAIKVILSVQAFLSIIVWLKIGPVHATAAEASVKISDYEKPKKLAEEEWPKTLHNAENAYQQGDYIQAIELYASLIQSGLENGYVYYNLGNSLLRSVQLGKSIAAYLKSTRLLPRNQDVQANLQYARKSIKDAIEPDQPSTLQKTLFFWHYNLSERELYLLIGIFGLLFWVGMIIRIFRRESESLRWTVMGLLILLLTVSSSLAVHALRPNDVAVVTEQEVKVHSSTNRKSTVLFLLHEGTEAELQDREDGWYKIRLSDGKRGWIKSDQVDVVR